MKNIFKDASGNTVVAQKPNLPLIVWAVFQVLSLLPLPTVLVTALSAIAFGSLFTWAWLELFQGVNVFRNILGATVMIILIFTTLDITVF